MATACRPRQSCRASRSVLRQGAHRRRAGALAKRRRAPATGAFLPSWLCLLCPSPPLFAPSSIHWEDVSGGLTRYPRSELLRPGGSTQQGRGERMGDAAKRTAASSAAVSKIWTALMSGVKSCKSELRRCAGDTRQRERGIQLGSLGMVSSADCIARSTQTSPVWSDC